MHRNPIAAPGQLCVVLGGHQRVQLGLIMKLVLEVDKSKAGLLVEFLRSLPFVKVKAGAGVRSPLAAELEEAVEELKLVRTGKKKTRTLKAFLDEG